MYRGCCDLGRYNFLLNARISRVEDAMSLAAMAMTGAQPAGTQAEGGTRTHSHRADAHCSRDRSGMRKRLLSRVLRSALVALRQPASELSSRIRSPYFRQAPILMPFKPEIARHSSARFGPSYVKALSVHH